MNANRIGTEALVTDLKQVVKDSEELMQASAGVVSEKAREVRERLAQTLAAARATCNRLEEKTIEGAKATDKIIREHPYQSMGVAFGIGVHIGVLAMKK